MRGDIIGVWPQMWREVWSKMAKHPEYGDNLFPDLYRELFDEPQPPAPPQAPLEFNDAGEIFREEDISAQNEYKLALEHFTIERGKYEESVSGGDHSRTALRLALKEKIKSEKIAVATLEKAFNVVSSYDNEHYSNTYFLLVEKFIKKFSLRYDLRRPFSLHPTLPGIFASLFRELKKSTSTDAHLNTLMHEFEDVVRDLKTDQSANKIKVCVQKQTNLLEALGERSPNVTANTLGAICDQIGSWPHEKVKDSVKAMYRFACDYPGIRHGGNAAHAIRDIEMRDMVAMSIMLAGFTPYLTDLLDSDEIYNGGRE